MAGFEENDTTRKPGSSKYEQETQKMARKNTKILFRAMSQSQIDGQEFAETVRRAFKPKHKCILIFHLTLTEVSLTKLVRDSPLPVVICQQKLDR